MYYDAGFDRKKEREREIDRERERGGEREKEREIISYMGLTAKDYTSCF